MNDDEIGVGEAADLLGVDPRSVLRFIRSGQLPARKSNGRRGPQWTMQRTSVVDLAGRRAALPMEGDTPQGSELDASGPSARDLTRILSGAVNESLLPVLDRLAHLSEELGAERARRAEAERRLRRLESVLRGPIWRRRLPRN